MAALVVFLLEVAALIRTDFEGIFFVALAFWLIPVVTVVCAEHPLDSEANT